MLGLFKRTFLTGLFFFAVYQMQQALNQLLSQRLDRLYTLYSKTRLFSHIIISVREMCVTFVHVTK